MTIYLITRANNIRKLGKNGEVVEIDGAYFGSNKFHKNGQACARENKTILGMAERKTSRYYFFHVNGPDKM